MSRDFSLLDSHSLSDLQVFLARAGRVEDGSVRLIADGGVLAVYVGVFYPAGLLDQEPTVLGLRTFALAEPASFDAVVPARSLVSRLEAQRGRLTDASDARPGVAGTADVGSASDTAAAPVTIVLPSEVATVMWAAISPPRGGWTALPPTSASILELVARAGIDEVAAAVPTGTGEQIVRRVRSEVWGRPIEGLEHVPAGAAFAAFSLGFLGDPTGTVLDDQAVRILEVGPWTRLSTDRGHVLVKRRAWSLLG